MRMVSLVIKRIRLKTNGPKKKTQVSRDPRKEKEKARPEGV